MTSNYRKIGDFIRQVNVRNDEGNIELLLGVNLDKIFIPSVANTNGTDMTKYKVIKKGQFGCKLMSVGRDKKLPISRLVEHEKALISSAYFVFEVIDESILNPEYLMMWFRREESDRFLWFLSGGDVRGRITWDDLCELPIKVPSIEKQNEIIKEYNTVVNRIKLNEHLNQKLEDTTQALYKHWFVDFEFPNEEGKPYKSSGGEMVYNEELDKEIPVGWEVSSLRKLCSIKHGFAFKGESFSDTETDFVLVSPGNLKINGGFNFEKNKFFKGEYPENYVLSENDLIVNMTDLSKAGDTLGNTGLIPKINFKKLLHNQRVGKFKIFDNNYTFFIYFLTNQSDYKYYILGTATGTTVRHTSPDRICEYKAVIPNMDTLKKFNKIILPFVYKINQNPSIQYKLKEMQGLLLSKMSKVEAEKEMI